MIGLAFYNMNRKNHCIIIFLVLRYVCFIDGCFLREYGRNISHNMSEEKKQRLKECQINYREAKKHLS